MMIKDKKVTIMNSEDGEPTNIKIIEFENDYTPKRDGVNKTINGYNHTLTDILWDIHYTLSEELAGAEAIAGMEPDTALSCENLYLDDDLYDEIDMGKPVLPISEDLIELAQYSVEQYKYLIRLIHLMISGSERAEGYEEV